MREAKANLAILTPAPDFDPIARAEWDRVVPELIKQDLVCGLDQAVLIAFCRSYSLWMQASKNVDEYGAVVKSPNGFPCQSPYLSIANKHLEITMRLAAEIGLTPMSRDKLKPKNSIHWGRLDEL